MISKIKCMSKNPSGQVARHWKLLVGAVALTAAGVTQAGSEAVLMQGFHWKSHEGANGHSWWTEMRYKAPAIRRAGVTHVWFPPASNSGAAEGYLPRELDNLNSNYGSHSQLYQAIDTMHANGIKAIGDVVVNHRVGCTSWADFCSPYWPTWYIAKNDEWDGNKSWNWDTGAGFHAARDIDHANSDVRNAIKNWMNYTLKGVGFDGWRFDYVKGFSASSVGEYASGTNPQFCVGELWDNLDLSNPNPHRQQLMDWINGTGAKCKAFDFTTKGLLNDAVNYGNYWRLNDDYNNPAGAIGWWPDMSVTFVDNHDTGPSRTCSEGQNHWPVKCNKVMQAYAYVLTHPGIPTIYWPHYFDWNLGGAIDAITHARKAAGVHSTSPVDIWAAQGGLYAARIHGSRGKLSVKLGWHDWHPGSGWTLVASGEHYAVWRQ
jgi:alpha-amylase